MDAWGVKGVRELRGRQTEGQTASSSLGKRRAALSSKYSWNRIKVC